MPSPTRRSFLVTSAGAVAATRLRAQPASWRNYELTTRIEVLQPAGITRIWAPLACDAPYQRARANTFKADAASARLVESAQDNLSFVSAEFPAGARPVLAVTSRVATRDWSADLQRPTHPTRPSDLAHFLRPTRLIPTDG